ncbi:aldo/keto reductase [Enterococcus faecium]|nr:aldo/keto reductase [Enterococcus faecium]
MKQDSYSVKDANVILSKLILGSSDYLKLDNKDKVDRMFTRYVEEGGRTFDTARHYRESEAVIGSWLKDKKREDYTIITKGCHPVREAPDTPRVNPESILADLTTSLEMLATDYVDVLLLHRDDPSQPVGPLMETLSQLVDEKKIRSFGVSNWELPRIIEAKNIVKITD